MKTRTGHSQGWPVLFNAGDGTTPVIPRPGMAEGSGEGSGVGRLPGFLTLRFGMMGPPGRPGAGGKGPGHILTPGLQFGRAPQILCTDHETRRSKNNIRLP